MKIGNNLPRNLRFLFGFLRGLMIFCAAVFVLSVLILPLLPKRTVAERPLTSIDALAEVTLTFEPGAYHVQATKAAAGEVELAKIRGKFLGNSRSADAEIASLSRWHFFLRLMVDLTFLYVLFDLLWRLCRNVERGEVFSESNTRYVRNLGLMILVYQAVACAAGYWYARMIEGFLLRRVVAEGVKLKLHWGMEVFPVSLDLIVIGLLLLVLGEVFRQGLALKKENELTV
jgi:hypothetical protein